MQLDVVHSIHSIDKTVILCSNIPLMISRKYVISIANINQHLRLTRPIQLILYFALISLHNFLYGICRFLCQRRPFSDECKKQRMLQTNRCGIYNLFSFCKQHQYAYPIIKMHCHNYNVKKYQIYDRQFLFRG